MTAARRTDPQRRDRIIDACLTVIAEEGVAGASHRRIALEADVPLGSMTYHFAGMDELLQAAFNRFADIVADRFEARMSAAATPDEARTAVVDIIVKDVFSHPGDLVLTHEIYTLAARRPEFRTITDRWMTRSRIALRRHFDADTTMVLDALITGLTIHRALTAGPVDDALVVEAVDRMLHGTTPSP